MEKLACMPTQRYGAPSRKVRNIFLGILSVELDGVHSKKWNAERVIVFQSAILQRAKGVNNSAQCRKHIFFQLDWWNCGAFGKIVKYTYNSAIVYLGKSYGNQTEEQRHRMFSNLVLKGKLHESVQFVCGRKKGGVLKPDELAKDRTGTINETVTSVLEGNNLSKTFPPVLRYKHTRRRLFLQSQVQTFTIQNTKSTNQR